MKKSLLFKIVVIVFAFVGLISVANAQVTTSSTAGTIKDASGPLPGASIKAIHTPTGTVYGVTTNADGRFTIGNMRVGGPYTFQVSFVGFNPQEITGIYLKLGEPFVLNLTLSDNSATLSEVKVVGSANPIMNSNKNGASTVITRAQIQSLPTITRSINDITRLTPQGSGTAGNLAGGNYRSNNFTVDGANFNNQFGIGGNVPGGGAPISLDALEQISVNVTPYDVRSSGFTGGAINAVTRSGTNEFSGTAFYTMRGDDQQGKKVGDYTIPIVNKLDEKQYGFSLGGPIIKNKLFFFVNGEFRKTLAPGQTKFAATDATPFGSNSSIARPTATFLNEVHDYLLNTYGYEAGKYDNYDFVSNNNKLFARIDWNISKNHRFNVRYNQVESKSPSMTSSSTTNSGVSYGTNVNRTSINSLAFANANYYQEANLYSGTAELTSSFGSKFTNSLRASFVHQNDPRSSDSELFPYVDILENGTPITSFGYESLTYGHLRDVKTQTYNDDFTRALGKHNVTIGAQAEFSTTKNGFQRYGTGFYTFDSWNDFITGQKASNFAITYPLTADGSQAYPSFKFAQYSAYVQDEFSVSDRFKLTLGLRVERPSYPSVSEIQTHPLIAAMTFANGEKINTGTLPESRFMFSPRLGFNWDVKGDRSVQVRGGSGIFTGRIPFVWLVAQSGDAGMLQILQSYTGKANTPVFSPDITTGIPATLPAAGTTVPSSISAMAPNLKFPQTWKSSLAVDVKLPGGVVGTIEGIYNRDLNAVYARNANLKDPVALNITGYPDAREMYGNSVANRQVANGSSRLDAIVMDNVKGGYYYSGSIQLNKQFSRGLSLSAAYTHSEAKNYGDGGGDQIANLWSIPYTVGNSNTPNLSYTSNVVPDRFIASVSYRKEYLKSLATTISLFYEGSIQGRFSYSYGSDFNRDGQVNDLIYIPRDASEITFVDIPAGTSGYRATGYTAQEQSDIFNSYVNNDKYLSEHKGEYAQRNGAKLPWRNQVDFKLVQEVFRNVGGRKNSFQFTMDVFNFGNLLSKKWGNLNFANNAGILIPQNVNALNTDPSVASTVKPTFRMAANQGDIVRESFGTTQTVASTYYMQFGVRYNFN